MGYPSPKDIYGTLKFEGTTYNLKNRKFSKELKKRLEQFIKKESIVYMPIYPHIPKNPFVEYEVIDNKLYISKINFSSMGLEASKSYKAIDIFDKEKAECKFDVILEAVIEIDEYMSGSTSVYALTIKYFNFINGELKTIMKKKIYTQGMVRKLMSYVEEGARGLIGVFWLDKTKIYDIRQELEDFDEKQNSNKIKIKLSDCEMLDYLKSRYEELRGDKYTKLDRGEIIYDVKNDEFIVCSNTKVNKKLIIDRFRLDNEIVRFEDRDAK